jgi:hypothetical protein
MTYWSARQPVGSVLSDAQEHDKLEGKIYAEQEISPKSFREKCFLLFVEQIAEN